MGVSVVFEPGMASLGPCVAAVGVFDGVHRGHQELLAAAVRDAERQGARAVAVTFDRDPDQVIDAGTAAPQLLTLEDKVRLIGEQGIEAVLIVPFTPQVAGLAPEQFLESVLATAMEVQSIHVGHDFRFGAKAAGDVSVLERWAVGRDADVIAHHLTESDGAPVTSTRIRGLVAEGDVAEAAELLGRPTRVSGTVGRGRGEGRELGVPTANVTPVAFAAIPADGVYAGLAECAEGVYAAAISVGTPPMFPHAKDYLEAHLIDFDGDLYDQPMTLQFLDRLRSQRRYDSLEELVSAIRKDVRETAELVDRIARAQLRDEGTLEDGSPVVDDIDALEAAEAAVRDDDPFDSAWEVEAEASWVVVRRAVYAEAGPRLANDADLIRAWSLLNDAGIPTGWDPFPPGSEATRFYLVLPRPVSLLVPEEYADQARELLEAADSGA